MGGPVLNLEKNAAADALRRFGSTAVSGLIDLVRSVYGAMPGGSSQWIRGEVSKHLERSENGLNTYLSERCARARIPAAERSMREALARARIEVLRDADIGLAPFDLRRAERTEHIFDTRPNVAQTTIYNVTGTQARVNVNSTDVSTNVVDIDARTLFAEMRQCVAQVEGDARDQLLHRIDAMEADQGKRSFAQRYAEFMELAANHVAVFQPFFPALAQLLVAAAGG
jgi:hypothetical protein